MIGILLVEDTLGLPEQGIELIHDIGVLFVVQADLRLLVAVYRDGRNVEGTCICVNSEVVVDSHAVEIILVALTVAVYVLVNALHRGEHGIIGPCAVGNHLIGIVYLILLHKILVEEGDKQESGRRDGKVSGYCIKPLPDLRLVDVVLRPVLSCGVKILHVIKVKEKSVCRKNA